MVRGRKSKVKQMAMFKTPSAELAKMLSDLNSRWKNTKELVVDCYRQAIKEGFTQNQSLALIVAHTDLSLRYVRKLTGVEVQRSATTRTAKRWATVPDEIIAKLKEAISNNQKFELAFHKGVIVDLRITETIKIAVA